MQVAAIAVSAAAEAMHPGLTGAIDGAGGAMLRGERPFAVVADGEAAGSIVVTRSRRPRLVAASGNHQIAFAEPDLAFAAAAIVALARDGAAAGADPASLALGTMAARVAARDIAVLIGGPTGTGKEVLARSIHDLSPRRDMPFVAVNCAALPEAMLEALLFGHERGAFTGAGGSARGLFRAADRGTLLLDEIAELPLALQAKLLRTLQEGEVLPIGATVPVKVDVRIVAAANRDLAAEVAAGLFRADLFYRLSVFPLATTALATRRADIVPIAAALWLRQGTTAWPTAAALARLVAHDWPGNVRELGNVLARAAVLATGERIEAGDIVFDAPPSPPVLAASLGGMIREREFDVIRSTLIATLLGLVTWLVFFGLDGHLRLFEVLVASYRTLPPGCDPLALAGRVAGFGALAFASGLMLALPVAAVLLMVNLLLAVAARSAPQLNLFAIGFPLLMAAGIVALAVAMPAMTGTIADTIAGLQDGLRSMLLG